MPMPRRRYSQVRITYEMLHSLLGLDDEAHIDFVRSEDNRHIISVHVSSDIDVLPNTPRTFDRMEAQEVVQHSITVNEMIENMRRRVQLWDEQNQSEGTPSESQEAMDSIYERLRARSTEEN